MREASMDPNWLDRPETAGRRRAADPLSHTAWYLHALARPLKSRSAFGHLDLQQRSILLRTEHVGIAGAAAWRAAVDRELDRQGRIEFDMVADPPRRKAENPAHHL